MTRQAIQASHPSLGDTIAAWLRSLLDAEVAAPRNTPDETRARRDFVCEMLDRNANAMTSETDVQSLALVYPGRF